MVASNCTPSIRKVKAKSKSSHYLGNQVQGPPGLHTKTISKYKPVVALSALLASKKKALQ